MLNKPYTNCELKGAHIKPQPLNVMHYHPLKYNCLARCKYPMYIDTNIDINWTFLCLRKCCIMLGIETYYSLGELLYCFYWWMLRKIVWLRQCIHTIRSAINILLYWWNHCPKWLAISPIIYDYIFWNAWS